MEATTPELGHVRFWSPKSSSFSGSDSIIVEEAAKNVLPSVNKSGTPNFFIEHDKVEDSKLHHYLETFGRALEQFLQCGDRNPTEGRSSYIGVAKNKQEKEHCAGTNKLISNV